jgi:hypothetical protein
MKIEKKNFNLNSFLTNMKLKKKRAKHIQKTNESAFSYDRDKNTFYRPNDESLIEYYDEEGLHMMAHSSWNH